MLSRTIIAKIEAKFGKENIRSGDCAALAGLIGVSETTVKRMLGLVGAESPERLRVPHRSTMDILARWLGYKDYNALLTELKEGDVASEFSSVRTIESSELAPGTSITIAYEPDRQIRMTYMGDGEFTVDKSVNSKLQAGDRLFISHLVNGQELIVKQVIRGDTPLGAFRAAKDGGLVSILML